MRDEGSSEKNNNALKKSALHKKRFVSCLSGVNAKNHHCGREGCVVGGECREGYLGPVS